DQIKEMTRKVSAEVDLVHQQTQNQRYGSSHIGATAKDISNVVTDAASGVVDIFHGIYKAVADTWNNFWKEGKADGIGFNLFWYFGSTAKYISNVVTDAASGVVDIFHGIDKAVADTWNNFWKDGKADGIGSNLSRK